MTIRRILNLWGASSALAFTAALGWPVNTQAASQRIAWVSFHAADNAPSAAAAAAGFTQAPDVEYTRLLQAAGHTVTRYVSTASPDTNLLNGFDLVIISRSAPSSHYQTAPSPGLWSGITKPAMVLSGYLTRASRLGMTFGNTMVDTTASIRLAAAQPEHPIFTGVTLDEGNVMVNTYADRVSHNGALQAGVSVNADAVADGATVLATVATDTDPTFTGTVIAEYPVGTVMNNASADILGGKRMVFLTGSREAGITSEGSGIWDLQTDGARLFLNTVHYLTGQPVVELPPLISNIRPTTGTKHYLAELGLSFQANSPTAGGIPEANITLTLNGTNVPAGQLTITGTPQARTVTFSSLVANAQYVGEIKARDAGGQEATSSFAFDTLDPQALPAAWAFPTSEAVTDSAGLRARILQATSAPTLANSSDRAEAQLAGTLIDPATTLPFVNEATPSTDNPDGAYNVNSLNYSVEAGLALERGNFIDPAFPDQPFPGLAHNNNVAIEVLAYLELAAGRYYMGVNSDDGFVAYAGPNARDLFATDVGRYDGGRGAADSIFQFRITQAGLYPFRLVYYQGDGGGNLEWFTMNPFTGAKTLINDRANPEGIKAWRQINVPARTYISSVSPARNAINIPVAAPIVIKVEEPGATVQAATVQLTLNGQVVVPQVTKEGTTTTISFSAPAALPSDTLNTVTLAFTDSAANARTATYQFKTEFVPPVVTDGANIVWVSFHAGDDQPSAAAAGAGFLTAPDVEYTRLLTNAGHTVTRYATTIAPDVDYLHTFDLVIVSRSNPSGNFGGAGATAYHSLTNPTIHLGGYGLRANRSGYFRGDTIPDVNSASVRLNIKQPTHPIFAGISVDGTGNMVNTYARRVTYNAGLQAGISANNNPVAIGGTVLATVGTAGDAAINANIVSEFPAGTVMANTAANVTAGHRLVFLTGSREAGITSEASGIFDLDGDGSRMFLNAVRYMAGLDKPAEPVTLTATRNGAGDLVITWPSANATGFVLQATTTLTAPDWQPVGGTPTVDAGNLSQAVPTTGTTRFFRLAKP